MESVILKGVTTVNGLVIIMIKQEPLKNKYTNTTYIIEGKRKIPTLVFHEEDVRGAVEWLKDNLHISNEDEYLNTLEYINKAFADVMEEKEC